MPLLSPEAPPRHVLAIDIGGTKLAVGIVSSRGEIADSARTPTHVEFGPDVVLSRIVGLSRDLLRRHPVAVDMIGVGCGGPLDTGRGLVKNPPNLPGWNDYPLVQHLQDALGLRVALDNDANAAALAEFHFGAGRGTRHMVYFTISTGIGGGLILNGDLYRGKFGNAGEIGHVQVEYDGEPCNCGGRGCLEHYASGTGIARRARKLAERYPDSLLNTLAEHSGEITAHTVKAALEANDSATVDFWAETIEMLAAGVASVVHAFDPERVVIGGGISKFGDLLFEPLRSRVKARTMPPLMEGVDIVPASCADDVGVLGAAAVALGGQTMVVS
ncbi:ROK family protein [Deinococcus yavapaiensis]|uniref:Glucokinase n=1 Tax=Deinococcus yavapaiensis KR-236 TaxID=694435 RepID=A0A318SBN4_9DEIO|nr:ROK family protein [Deinococcus yavapaiensis]PYE54611.1 glucokinase [Deinococcus yavapaiensis KR-236]